MKLPLVALGLLLFIGCAEVRPPERVPGIPESAIWAGGADGGAWIDCEYKFKEPYVGYACQIYNEFTGGIWSSGVYILGEYNKGEFVPYAGPLQGGQIKNYNWYNGVNIGVTKTRILVPNGWIDHPFGDGHGKRDRYVSGEEQEVVSY